MTTIDWSKLDHENKQRHIDAYNARGKSQVIDWEPCQECPTCHQFADGYKRVDGTCFVICEACEVANRHDENCPYRCAMTCAVAIECEEHGSDVCSICDACTCKRDATSERSSK